MKHTLEGPYTPKNIEDKLYNFWKESGFFHASGRKADFFMQLWIKIKNHIL